MILAESFSASLHNLDQVFCIKQKHGGFGQSECVSFSSGNLTESRRLQNPCFPSRRPLSHWVHLPSQLVTDSLPKGTVLVILDNE